MAVVLLMIGAFAGYILAYHTYGKYLARRVFDLDSDTLTPAQELADEQDYVPSRVEILFSHHFTSIAGTGPIVGPAIGVIWGWAPAFVWVFLGPIVMGAVHDFGALVLSLRHQGRSIGDLAGDVVNARVRTLFLLIIFFSVLIVIAIFCLVIATLFQLFPESVLPVWIQIPIALAIGHLVYRRGASPLLSAVVGVALLYAAVVVGAWLPITMPTIGPLTPLLSWTIILLVYAYLASVLPVWRLLQPRDYINGQQLFVALLLLVAGVIVTHPPIVAPAFRPQPPGAPPIWPMLFVTIACGAISGFHCLVSSGTTSKQLSHPRHALTIGYGSMLLEGALAVLVIIAVAAGIGLGHEPTGLEGIPAWNEHYKNWAAAQGLGPKVEAFVRGSANMLEGIGIPYKIATTLMGVLVACFAGTTLDTATRLQRYVVSELGPRVGLTFLKKKHLATLFAVGTAAALAFPGKGKGGLILWPVFGATNQLLASLALLVITVYLLKRGKSVWVSAVPMVFMVVVTAWAMVLNIQDFMADPAGKRHLIAIAIGILILEVWMIAESVIVMARCRLERAGAEAVAPEG